MPELWKNHDRGRRSAVAGRCRAGFSYDSIFSADNFPMYALRSKDGGALIQYALSRTTTTTTKTAENDYTPVPEPARWAIGSPVLRRRRG
jgi:hypothetical protein